MRRGLICGVLGMLLMAACGSPACGSQSAGTHHAYVVVQHLSGSWLERKVDFSGDAIDGVAAMDRSGLEYHAESVTSGKVVCQVDDEPASFTTCFPQNKPYWALFVMSGGKWSSALGGVSDVRLHDGEAMGWHYVQAGAASAAPPPMPKAI
jgi:hypothetical protein